MVYVVAVASVVAYFPVWVAWSFWFESNSYSLHFDFHQNVFLDLDDLIKLQFEFSLPDNKFSVVGANFFSSLHDGAYAS
jgi:hypothetical protein